GRSRRPNVGTLRWQDQEQSWQVLLSGAASKESPRGGPDESAALSGGNGFDQCADIVASRDGVRQRSPGVDGMLHPPVHGQQVVQLLAGVFESASDDVAHQRAGTPSQNTVADDFLDLRQREAELLGGANEAQALALRSREQLVAALRVPRRLQQAAPPIVA